MPKKPETTRETSSPKKPSDRVRFALDAVFAGSQSKMAKALGCSQPTISRIVAGKMQPRSSLLLSLAAQPRLNRDWVLTGKGDPLLGSGRGLSVARCLLPGMPKDCPKLLSNERAFFPSEQPDNDSLYIVEVQEGLTVPSDRILPGDHFLIESDPRAWLDNLKVLHNRLCVIRSGKGNVELRRVRCSEAKSGVSLEFWKSPERHRGKELRGFTFSTEDQDDAVREKQWKKVALSGIAGVVRAVFWQP